MTDNIVQFPGPDTVIYLCSCSCQTFRIYPTGVIECANCGESHTNHVDGTPVGEWVKLLVPVPKTIERDESGTTSIRGMTAPFARSHVVKAANDWAKAEQLAMICLYHHDGTGKQWFDINTEEQKQWMIRKLTEVLEFVNQTAVEK